MSTKPKKIRVLELVPSEGHASKPAELIQIRGHDELTLNARRAITILWHNAHRQGIEEGRRYQISIDLLVTDRHKGSQPVVEAVESLMRTILVIPLPNGGTRRVQLLGGNDMDDPGRPAGMLTYSFDWHLIQILQDSSIWGKISISALRALSSRYSVSLYEAVSQWAGLIKNTQELSLEEFRAMLGVAPDKYVVFGEFNREILKRSVNEINALAPFNISAEPLKTGKKVTRIRLSWWPKTKPEQEAAEAEISRSKVGRRARISRQAEMVFAPSGGSHVDNPGDNPVDNLINPGSSSPKTS